MPTPKQKTKKVKAWCVVDKWGLLDISTLDAPNHTSYWAVYDRKQNADHSPARNRINTKTKVVPCTIIIPNKKKR